MISEKTKRERQTRFRVLERPYGDKYTGNIIHKDKNNKFAYYTYEGNIYIVEVPYSFRDEIKQAEKITVVKKDENYIYHSSI